MKIVRTAPYKVKEVFKPCEYTSDGYTMKYRIYIPKNYDCGEKYPLLVFLHGAGERGGDNEKQLTLGLQAMFDDIDSPAYDSVIIAPQCPEDSQWVLTPWCRGNYSVNSVPESRELETVCAIMDETAELCNIDSDRVYITGISMGGFGTWDMLMRHGSRFAAGMPVCGGGDESYAALLKRIPIRTFHGSEDEAVPVSGTRKMYAAIRREGGEQIEYTEFDGYGHNVWDMVYENGDNIRWLFSQSRRERREAAEKRDKIKKTAAAGGIGLAIAAVLAVAGFGKIKKKKQK